MFQPFGPVELVDLHKDAATGKSKGYAFVQFVSFHVFTNPRITADFARTGSVSIKMQ